MLVIEGLDGTGKSALACRLSINTGLKLHPRAVADQTGEPVTNLFEWAKNDVETWDAQPLSIYDRHPLVSEYIYGPIIRGKVVRGFNTKVAAGLRETFRRDSLVIFCLTDIKSILANQKNAEQMDGVAEHVEKLYLKYVDFISNYEGRFAVYDYNSDDNWNYTHVLAKVQDYITERTEIRR